MTLLLDFDQPFYTGLTGSSDEVPGKFDVALAGRGFMVDWKSQQYRRSSIPLLRQQADQSIEPSESSINPDDLWRRSASSWHKGAGQRNFDQRTTSDPDRYWSSKGIDPWTEGQISLLPGVDQKKNTTNTNLFMVPAGTRLYLCDGTNIRYTTDVTVDTPTWSDITGEPATAATSITSDGFNVWSAHGTDGIYATTRTSSSTSSYATGTVSGVKFVKGRLLAWAGNKLYNITGSGALPTALHTVSNTDFTFVDAAEAAGFYFTAGYSGDKSLVYHTAVKSDGTALDVPMVAAELPDGEVVRSLQGYLGFLVIGTDQGLRFGVPGADGSVTLGGLIETEHPVLCFEPQDRFVWFGWTDFDDDSTGLGRIDLSTFNGTAPAYASDLMVTAQGTVQSVVTFQGIRVFTVSGSGVYGEDTDLVESGSVSMGRITYGLFDEKVAMYVSISHEPLVGSLAGAFSRDTGEPFGIGVSSTVGETSSQFPTNRTRGDSFDITLTLNRSADDPTEGPVVGRITLRANPNATRSEMVLLPLLIGFEQRDGTGSIIGRDPLDDLEYLELLEASGDSFTYQEGGMALTVIAEDHDWQPVRSERGGLGFNGTYLIHLKRFATE